VQSGVERIVRSAYGPAMRIAIASDHAALDLKAQLREWLIGEGHEVADLGPDSHDSVDYPDFGYRLADVVADGTAERGIALCGSGIGISISVNRDPRVRCALVSEPVSATMPTSSRSARG
jgi:ribose 5-phosphate isomerase B